MDFSILRAYLKSLIVNNQTTNFYNHITKLLQECQSFYFNVAFINFSGLQLLLDSFKILEEKKINGKILTSTYLNFTQPKALEKIKEFGNIKLKIYDSNRENIGFHPKSYIFEFEDCFKILIGSSNITSSAFKSNIEWNVKVVSKKDDDFLSDVLSEFESLWNSSYEVDEKFLQEYKIFVQSQKKVNQTFHFRDDIKRNFMQELALQKLEQLRKKGEKKALIIAATGSGKSYLSAFDAKNFKAKKLLFLVHRENILLKAKKSFEAVFKNSFSYGLFTGNKKEKESDYIFSTIQTMSNSYLDFSIDYFDYIVVDEAHHVTSPTYKKVIEYFKPKFLLGLTATSNRMDGNSVYEVFDENIACDIALFEALKHDLITPFHYYGISDIETIDYENIDLTKIDVVAKLLSVNKRVDFIVDKMNFYSFSGTKRRVLGFCISKEHAFYMNEEFNKRGINSAVLTNEDSIKKREETIQKLEDENDALEVIFSIDIFNEGVDIPSVNMVLFLRPTNSSIVFTQQLGRGLRKYKNKEFLTVLDFIGNHEKSHLIALALSGNRVIDKESIKFSLQNNFANFKNVHICMDEISKNRIRQQIEKENFNKFKYLKEDYFSFKNILENKIPKLVDFLQFEDEINPIKFIDESKSYIEFLAKVENQNSDLKKLIEDENFIKAIRFVDGLLPIKRVYEFVILKYLLENKSCTKENGLKILDKYLDIVDEKTLINSFCYLNQDFLDSAQTSRYLKLINFDGKEVVKTKEFEKLLENKSYKDIFEDSLNFGIYTYEKEFGTTNFGVPFLKIYEKYNMLNIAQLCNFPKIHSSFRGSGFLKYENDFFLFINLEKEKFSKSAKYDNAFLSKTTFTYQSKPSHSSDKGDGERLCENEKFGVKLHIFVRKYVQVDKKTQDFMYLGLANKESFYGNKPISLVLKLEKALPNYLFEEFTKIV